MKTKFILALAAGFAAAASVEAATTVTTYSAGSQPASVALENGISYLELTTAAGGPVGMVSTGGGYFAVAFTRGSSLPNGIFYLEHGPVSFNYYNPEVVSDYWMIGAQAGDANYALLDLDDDSVCETVGQFHFGALGATNYVLALATNSDGSALSISAGKTAIDASISPVPEVSGHLALLALGSAGVLTRRRLKRAE